MQKDRPKWDKVNLPRAMVELVEKYLEMDIASQRGLKNRSDVAIEGVKLVLERDGVYGRRSRLEHLNMYDDHVKVIDNESSRIASVYFKETDVFCDLCETNICLHTDFAYSIPKVLEALKRRGHTIQQNYHKV